MSLVQKGLVLLTFFAAQNAQADYWKITIQPKEQTSRFGHIQYIFKIDSYDFLKISEREKYGKVNWNLAKSVPATEIVDDNFFMEGGDKQRVSFRQVSSTWSNLGEGFPSQCGSFEYKLKMLNGSNASGFSTRSGILPTIMTDIGGERYELGRVVGSAFAIQGSNIVGIVPQASNAPGLLAFDVLQKATFVYDKRYYAECRSLIESANDKLIIPAWWPQNVPLISVLTEGEGKAIYMQALSSRLRDAILEKNMAYLASFKDLLTAEENARFYSQAKDYWQKKYREETEAIKGINPSNELLIAITKKVPLSQASQWDEVDFDNLAPKAKKILQLRAEKENARIANWRKKVKIGVDTHCGPVIEMRAPMYKVALITQLQGFSNEAWLKDSELFPPEYGCKNINGKLGPLNSTN